MNTNNNSEKLSLLKFIRNIIVVIIAGIFIGFGSYLFAEVSSFPKDYATKEDLDKICSSMSKIVDKFSNRVDKFDAKIQQLTEVLIEIKTEMRLSNKKDSEKD